MDKDKVTRWIALRLDGSETRHVSRRSAAAAWARGDHLHLRARPRAEVRP